MELKINNNVIINFGKISYRIRRTHIYMRKEKKVS